MLSGYLTAKCLPPEKYLHECFEYLEDGTLVWRARPLAHFATSHGHKIFLAKYVGKVAGVVDNNYVKIGLTHLGKRTVLAAHRIVWVMCKGQIPEGYGIDHKDTNPLNNKTDNLRLTLPLGNSQNSTLFSTNTSGVKGVRWNKQRQLWEAKVSVNYKLFVGFYKSVEAATIAVQNARIRLHGEFVNHG